MEQGSGVVARQQMTYTDLEEEPGVAQEPLVEGGVREELAKTVLQSGSNVQRSDREGEVSVQGGSVWSPDSIYKPITWFVLPEAFPQFSI